MLALRGKLSHSWEGDPFVARVTTNSMLPFAVRGQHVLLRSSSEGPGDDGFPLVLAPGPVPDHGTRVAGIPDSLRHLADGDVVQVNPKAGTIFVLYRLASEQNALLATGRCNCRCMMCPQPPISRDDPWHFEALRRAIPLMSPRTECLGITGGEPTLLGARLVELLRLCRAYLPATVIHLLTNARALKYMGYARAVADAAAPAFLAGIPLYSDLAGDHDYICQARGAFDDTIRGILNLHRAGAAVELRFVVHSQTVGRMVPFARFLSRNLPFVSQVAVMGLETVGFGATNGEFLWVDPVDIQDALVETVQELDSRGIKVSLFNMQLCVLPKALWKFARQSISDWKNEFLPVCESCAERNRCAGFFALATARPSRAIRPIPA